MSKSAKYLHSISPSPFSSPIKGEEIDVEADAGTSGELRHLVPKTSLKLPAGLIFVCPAPLFEEKGDSGINTLVSYLYYPFAFHWSCPRSGFAADDHPINTAQVQIRDRAEHRLNRKELDASVGLSEAINSICIFTVLYTDSHPDIVRPYEGWIEIGKTLRPFGEYLKLMLRCPPYNIENFMDECMRYVLMKKIAHGIHKHERRPCPYQRRIKDLIVYSIFESINVIRLPHGLQPQCHSLCITIAAPKADLGAPCD